MSEVLIRQMSSQILGLKDTTRTQRQIINTQGQEIQAQQRRIDAARDLLAVWKETPDEGDPMIDTLLGVVRAALDALQPPA